MRTDTWGTEIGGAGDFTGLSTGKNAISANQVKACGGPGPHGTGGPNGVVTFTVGEGHQPAAGNGITKASLHGNVSSGAGLMPRRQAVWEATALAAAPG